MKNIEQYIDKFCFCIEMLIKAWNTASDYNYIKFNPEDYGLKANYLAIKLTLTRLDDELPYMSHKWRISGSPKEAKKKYPEVPNELKNWKIKANALDTDTELFTYSIEPRITQEKVERFIRLAGDIIYTQSNSDSLLDRENNQKLCIEGQTVNKLALELGLVDPDWYLAFILGAIKGKTSKDNTEEFENIKLICEDLQIDLSCTKLPFTSTGHFQRNGYVDEEEIERLIAKAKTLLDTKPETEEVSVFKASPDFRNITATLNFNLTEDQANCIKILWEEYQKKGQKELSGDYILVKAGIVENNKNDKKMKEVFKRSPAWNSLIIPSKKGFYRLGI